jgi:hypothetical protein
MNRAYQQGTAADTTRMFNLSGAFGGSANQNAVANNQNALANQMKQYITSMQNDQYNRSAQLQEQDLSRGSQAYQNERGRQIQAINPGMANVDQAMKIYQGQLGVGDALRGYNQDLLNQQYTDWQNARNYPQQQEDWFTGLLSRAMGGMSPSSTTTTSGYQASPFSQLFGGALLANSLYGGGK